MATIKQLRGNKYVRLMIITVLIVIVAYMLYSTL